MRRVLIADLTLNWDRALMLNRLSATIPSEPVVIHHADNDAATIVVLDSLSVFAPRAIEDDPHATVMVPLRPPLAIGREENGSERLNRAQRRAAQRRR